MIYLDANASTPLDPEVRSAMQEASDAFGNPSSVHAEGQKARRLIEDAREEVGRAVKARPEEIFFTSGGTEANALAIFGSTAGRPGRVVVSGAEHPSVREAAARLAASGSHEVVSVSPEPSGALDPARVLEAVTPGTVLVSIMAANNEYGGVFPVPELAAEVRRRGSLFHTDAVQALGRLPVDAAAWGVDLMSLSAHKLHGPKGAGALFVRRSVPLSAHTPGGGQERRLRAGTENTTGIVGMGRAASLAAARQASDSSALARLRDRLERGILDRVAAARIVGGEAPRLPNTCAVLFEEVSGETLLMRLDLDGVAVSVGSACSSGTVSASPALLALGLSAAEAKSVVRFSLSRQNTESEIDRVLALLPRAVAEARAATAAAPVGAGR